MKKKIDKRALLKKNSNLTQGRFKALIENAYDGIVLYDAKGIILYASPSIRNIGGFAPEELLGKNGADFVYHEDASSAKAAFYKVLMMPGKSITQTQRFITKGKQILWAEYTLTNLLETPEVNGIVSNFRDVHQRKLAEERANRSGQLLNTISENIVDGIFSGIPGQEFQYVNKAFLKITGYKSLEELRGLKPHHLFMNHERWKEVKQVIEKEGKIENEIIAVRRKNGEFFWAKASLSLFDDNGMTGFAGSIQDVTQQKHSEEELLKSQQLLNSISQNIKEGIFRSDGKKFLFVNVAFAKMFGYEGIKDVLHVHPQALYVNASDRKEVLSRLKKGEVLNREIQYKKSNGNKFWGLLSCTRVKGANGEFLMDGAVRDITQQKDAEKQLNQSRNFLDNVMQTVAAPIFVKDSKHRWIMFNDAFCWFMDKERKELMGKTDHDFLSKEESKVFWKVDNQVLRTGDVVLNRNKITIQKSKVKHLLTVKSRYINDAGEKFVIGFITDITEINKREEDIVKLNANLLGVMESSHDSIYAIDKHFNYIAFNKNHAKMSRLIYGAEISVGSNTLSFVKATPEYKWLHKELTKALKGEHFVSEQHLNQPRYKDKYIETIYNPIFDKKSKVTGVAVFVRDITELKLAREVIAQSNARLNSVIESTRDRIVAVDRQFRYIMFNKSHAISMKKLTGKEISVGDDIIKLLPREIGTRIKKELLKTFKGETTTIELTIQEQHLEISLNPIQDVNGRIIGATFFGRDISGRKKNEEKVRVLNEGLISQNWQLATQEEKLKATLEELSERNFELDQLMYKTSHDLRSPLSSILGLVNLAHLDANKENHLTYFNKIEDRIKKLDEFIKSMLNYARVNRSDVTYEQIDLAQLIDSSVAELEYLENFSALKIVVSKAEKNVTLKSDLLRIKIVIANVISNAFKYYNPAEKSYLKISIHISPQQATIIFRDNGIGIKKEHVPKIFDMFYRATEKSQGSGLGMYIVKQAIDKLRGSISVKSVFAEGTTIKIILPNN